MSDNPFAQFKPPAGNPFAQFKPPAAIAPPDPPASIAEQLWSGIKGAAEQVVPGPRFVQGVAEGVMGEGIPEERASQFEGGRARFAGRAIGTGAKGIGEVLWEGIKAPGKMLTGEMQIGPEAEAAARGIALGAAGMGGWRPGMTLPRHQVPVAEAPPQRLLPPPTVEIAGQPATAAGEGLLPPGPTSTMTRPDASPPPTSPRPAAGLEPEPPPPVTPPAPVEVVPRNPRQDAATAALYRKAVKPGPAGQRNAPQLAAQDQAIATGVDKIIETRPTLKLTDIDGVELPAGTAPRNMRQFAEAIDQSKTALFEKWNTLAQRAGEEGLRIELAPVVSELRALATKPEIAHVNPAASQEMLKFADIYERQGFYTPLEAQGVIKGINKKWSDKTGLPEVMEPIARLLRKQLDEGIEGAVGPGWQQFRKEYGALSAIENDVTRAAQRIANKPNSGLGAWANMLGSAEFVHGVMMLNPHAIWRAAGLKGSGELHRFLNDPNRMIAKLFDKRIAGPPAPMGYRLSDKIVPPSLDPLLEPAVRAGAVGMGTQESGGFPRMPRTSVGGP